MVTAGPAGSRAWAGLAHLGPVLVLAAGALTLPAGWPAWPLVVTVALFAAGQLWHLRHLCLRCTARVQRMPDPQAVADRHRRWFRVVHLVDTWSGVVAVVVGCSVVNALFAYLPGATTQLLVICALLARLSWASLVHGQVIPWCRFCRNGGGGGDRVPAPGPVPTAEVR